MTSRPHISIHDHASHKINIARDNSHMHEIREYISHTLETDIFASLSLTEAEKNLIMNTLTKNANSLK